MSFGELSSAGAHICKRGKTQVNTRKKGTKDPHWNVSLTRRAHMSEKTGEPRQIHHGILTWAHRSDSPACSDKRHMIYQNHKGKTFVIHWYCYHHHVRNDWLLYVLLVWTAVVVAAASVVFAPSEYELFKKRRICNPSLSSVNRLRCSIDCVYLWSPCLLNNFTLFYVLDLGVLQNHDIVGFWF